LEIVLHLRITYVADDFFFIVIFYVVCEWGPVICKAQVSASRFYFTYYCLLQLCCY
jgi:hypothetical protein